MLSVFNSSNILNHKNVKGARLSARCIAGYQNYEIHLVDKI